MLGSGADALHVHLTGQGPPVLYLHGFPEYFGIWRPLLARTCFAQRAILVDLPGFNLSSPSSDAAAPEIARRLRQGLNALGVAQFDIVAHDIGGAFAWQLTSDCCDRVRSLFLLSSPHPADFIRHFWQERPEARLAYLDALIAGSFDYDAERLANLVLPDDPAGRGLLESALRRTDAAAAAALYGANLAPRWLDRWSRLPPAACATRALSGRADRFVPPAVFAGLPAQVVQPCEAVLLDHGGHFLQITQTAAVAAHLDAWLSASAISERRFDDVL